MALTDYKPAFPYSGNQVIISSGRVLLHSRADSVFLFGKKAVSISTPGTLNIDASSGVTINAPVIELGIGASDVLGEPIVKGKALITQLNRLLSQIENFSEAMTYLASEEEDFAASIPPIISSAKVLSNVSKDVMNKLDSILSTTTFTL